MKGPAELARLTIIAALMGAIIMLGPSAALADNLESEAEVQTPRMVKDVPIPICQDIGVGGKETNHSTPTSGPILPGPGREGNVLYGLLPTGAAATAWHGPTPIIQDSTDAQ